MLLLLFQSCTVFSFVVLDRNYSNCISSSRFRCRTVILLQSTVSELCTVACYL